MLVVVITCVVVIAALVVANLRQRTRMQELEALARDTADERAAADARAAAAETAMLAAEHARDEAIERVQRSRRDAAEVANRLSAETAARAELESELDSVRQDLAAALDAGNDGTLEQLWQLSLRRVEQTWRLSVAVDPSSPSPLDDSDDPFRTAVEIEVDAAREEAGAVIETEWSGDAPVPVSRATVGLALVRDVVDSLGTSAERTTLTLSRGVDALELTVDAVDADGRQMPVSLPADLETSPGTARIE